MHRMSTLLSSAVWERPRFSRKATALETNDCRRHGAVGALDAEDLCLGTNQDTRLIILTFTGGQACWSSWSFRSFPGAVVMNWWCWYLSVRGEFCFINGLYPTLCPHLPTHPPESQDPAFVVATRQCHVGGAERVLIFILPQLGLILSFSSADSFTFSCQFS